MSRLGTARAMLGLAVTLLVAASSTPLALTASAAGVPGRQQAETILFSIPIGADGVTYANRGEEQRPWGPAALEVGADGTFWIADTAADRVLGYTRTGARQHVFDLVDRAVGITDIVATADRLALLDVAAWPPAILTIDRDNGATIARDTVPEAGSLRDGLRGIRSQDGTLVIETGSGVIGGRDDASPTVRRGARGAVSIELPSRSADRRSAAVTYGGVTFAVDVEATLNAVYFLGDTAAGGAFTVDEIAQDVDGTLLVDRTVRVFDPDGHELGRARVPLVRSLYVQNGIAITPDGEIVALVARETGAMVLRLNLVSSLDPILPSFGDAQPQAAAAAGGETVTTCRSFIDMYNTANGYRDNSRSLTAANISGTCGNRTAPRYLGAPGTYPSVSYDWDGFDTVSGWNSYMASGKQAGNIAKTATTNNCAKGVDCSGFVSRVWGLGTHVYTASLDSISTTVSGGLNYMIPFDIFLKQGSHVIFFSGFDDYGDFYVYESTTTNNWDRVVFHLVDATYVAGYEMRRYNNRC